MSSDTRTVANYLARIDRYDSQLNAFVHVNRAALSNPARGKLSNHPLAIKDLLDVAGEPTTAASNVLAGNVAQRDAEAVRRLRAAGATFLGKTTLHEFAYGGSGIISNREPARNPWNPAHITGGSSSGSAAAVAAGLCWAAIGTDTAGSIRLPASFCGIVGFKPTYGVVSTEGVIPLSGSYDHVGPMTRSVGDARLLFEVLIGKNSLPVSVREKLRIGIPEKYFFRDLETEVANVMSSAMDALRKAGHQLQNLDLAVDEDRTLASWESYTYHAHWVKQSPGLYQAETLRRIRSGEKITAEAAKTGRAKLNAIRDGAAEIFADIDVLLTPTVPVQPPAIDDLLGHPETLRPRELLMLRNTRPFNVLGVPTINLPWGLAGNGLPVGIQLAAAPHKDFELLAIAGKFELLAPWQGRTPPEFP